MSNIRLSIVTPTTYSRESYLPRMLTSLQPQLVGRGDIEHIILTDGGGMSLGKKMNYLYDMAVGDYIVTVNDDDLVPSNYVELIFNAMTTDPDIIVGQIKTGWVDPSHNSTEYESEIIHRFENVMPAKGHLVKKYMKWDANGNSYTQDSDLARTLEAHAGSCVRVNEILYYHLRRKKV